MFKNLLLISLGLSFICSQAFAQATSETKLETAAPKKESPLARDFRDQSEQGLKLTNEVIAKYKAQQFAKLTKKSHH